MKSSATKRFVRFVVASCVLSALAVTALAGCVGSLKAVSPEQSQKMRSQVTSSAPSGGPVQIDSSETAGLLNFVRGAYSKQIDGINPTILIALIAWLGWLSHRREVLRLRRFRVAAKKK